MSAAPETAPEINDFLLACSMCACQIAAMQHDRKPLDDADLLHLVSTSAHSLSSAAAKFDAATADMRRFRAEVREALHDLRETERDHDERIRANEKAVAKKAAMRGGIWGAGFATAVIVAIINIAGASDEPWLVTRIYDWFKENGRSAVEAPPVPGRRDHPP